MGNKILDLRGLSCPIPLIRTRDALANCTNITVVVDDLPPKENILRFVNSQGFQAVWDEKNGEYTIQITK